jgi:hypothetical protein
MIPQRLSPPFFISQRVPSAYPICRPFGRNIRKIVLILFSIFFVTTYGSRNGFAEDIALQWDPSHSANVAGYKVHVRAAGGGYYYVEDVGDVTTRIIRGLPKDQSYVFSITAYDASGSQSSHSNAVRWGSDLARSGFDSGDGCLIAAVAYGSPHAREVLLLKRLRDRYLDTCFLGRLILKACEWISPPLVDLARRNETFRVMTRWGLAPVVYTLEHLWRSALLFVACAATVTIGVVFYRRRKRKAIS